MFLLGAIPFGIFAMINEKQSTYTAARRRRNKRKVAAHADGPLVPVDRKRLQAAIRWRGLSVNGLAKAVDLKQTTLNSVVMGKAKRCRRKPLTRMAKLLRVPSEWLGGAGELPDVPENEVHRMRNVREGDGKVADMYYVRVPGESLVRGPIAEVPALPPRVQLEARDAIQVLRLLFDPDGSPFPDGWDRRYWPVSPDYKTAEALVLRDLNALPRDVLALFSLEHWRSLLFGAQRRPWYPTPEEADQFAEALGTVLRLVLAPAIEGKAHFDVPARRSSLEAQRWVGQRLPPTEG